MRSKSMSGGSGFNDRALEWLCAGIMLSWCVALALVDDAMTRPPLGLFERHGESEAFWASLFGAAGLARVAALYVNGRWPRTPLIRTVCAGLGFVVWSQLSWLFALGFWVSNTQSATGAGVYGMLALAELYSIYRAAHDVRYDHL